MQTDKEPVSFSTWLQLNNDPKMNELMERISTLEAELKSAKAQLESLYLVDPVIEPTDLGELIEDLSVKTYNALRRAGFLTVGDVLPCLTRGNLRGVRMIGKFAEAEIANAFKKHGYIK